MQDTDILDLVTTTLQDLGRNTFEQIAQELQSYEVMSRWLKSDKVTFDGGIGIKRTLMDKMATSASHVGLYEELTINVEDLLTTMNIGWVRAQTYWAWERRELLENRGAARILNIIQPRRLGSMLSLAAELESKAWASPAADNALDPYGIPYWIVKNATAGFNGGAPTGHTLIGNVNLTSHPHFKNYTFTYSAVTKADLVKKLRKAARQTNFKSPIENPENRTQISDRFRLYTNESLISDIEDVGEAQNENLGRDVASMDDTIVFHRNPIIYIPALDADTTNPMYGINHGTFFPVVLSGDYLYEHSPEKVANRPNVFHIVVDLSYNYLCLDRRRNWVTYKV
jgi:hypothetical protein